MKSIWIKLAGYVLPIVLLGTGCTGTQTFTTAARPGETVGLAVGWHQNLKRQNVSVTINDASGAQVVIPQSSPKVRGIVNMYPDPVSRAIVGFQTNQTLGSNAKTTGLQINNQTGSDSDWCQTSILLELPLETSPGVPLAQGIATITMTDSGGATIRPINVEILPGTSSSNLFNIYSVTNPAYLSTTNMLSSFPETIHNMERADNSTITFNTYQVNGVDVVPHSIQLQFTHNPDSTTPGGVGKTYVVNPRGDIKNVIWRDDGTNLNVMITPAKGTTLGSIINLKFYIAGGITGLSPPIVKAYDINGNLMAGITASIQ